MAIEIKLPDLGDGIDSGDVLEILVSEGDQIEKEQGIVELETDKATVEVPATQAGVVTKIHVNVGDSVSIGGVLISIEASSATAEPQAAPVAPVAEPAPAPTPPAPTSPAPAPVAPAPAPVDETPAAAATPAATPPAPQPVATVQTTAADIGDTDDVHAGPAVRRFAREVGVDLSRVTGSGVAGRITREDVLAVVRSANKDAPASKQGDATQSDAWGKIRVEKMPRIRKAIAAKMHESWTTAPRVTNFDDADVTELETIRQQSKADYAAAGIKLTSMPFLIKAVALALKANPDINATVDMEAGQITFKEYVNIGIAVDTPRGLIVPSLRNADDLSVSEIARELDSLATNARENNFAVEDLKGSTFTISNLGAIGGTYSTPIINVPEVAILLVGRSRKLPVIVDDKVVSRLMMPMSLSYDHRVVDGAMAARFLNDLIGFLQAPARLLLAP